MLAMLISLALSAFVLGSIPFSALVALLFKRVKIHTIGDKNPGARNVYHTLGLLPGLLALLLDMGKGMTLVMMARVFDASLIMTLMYLFIGLMGHAFSPFLKFRGGQGVAMLVGALAYLFPIPAMIAGGVFFLLRHWGIAFDLRYSLALVLFTFIVFFTSSISWMELTSMILLFIFPLIKGYFFPKK